MIKFIIIIIIGVLSTAERSSSHGGVFNQLTRWAGDAPVIKQLCIQQGIPWHTIGNTRHRGIPIFISDILSCLPNVTQYTPMFPGRVTAPRIEGKGLIKDSQLRRSNVLPLHEFRFNLLLYNIYSFLERGIQTICRNINYKRMLTSSPLRWMGFSHENVHYLKYGQCNRDL